MSSLDYWIYPEYKTDPERLLRGRIIVGLSYFNLLLCIAAQFVVYMLITRSMEGSGIGHTIVLFFIVFYCFLLFAFRRWGSFFWAGNVLCLVSFIGTTTAIYIGGSYPAPMGVLVVLVPVLAFLVPGQKSGLFWTAVVVVSEILFAYLADSPLWGQRTPYMPEQAYVPGALMASVITVGIIAGGFYIIDRLNLDLRRELFVERSFLEYNAAHDSLTGLYNRRAFDAIFKDITKRAANDPFALLYLDLDGFKPINDSLGHEVGDELLMKFGERLQRAIRDDDVVARIGGDEFAIIVKRVDQVHQVERILQGLLQVIRQPLDIAGQVFVIKSSIGVAFWPAQAESQRELFMKADNAMYQSKRLGSAYTFC